MASKNPKDLENGSDTENPLLEHSEDSASGRRVSNPVFRYSTGLTDDEADALRKVHGKNELPESTVPKWYIFLSLLWQPMPIMIWIAAIIEGAIENFIDMGILLLILFGNATISFI